MTEPKNVSTLVMHFWRKASKWSWAFSFFGNEQQEKMVPLHEYSDKKIKEYTDLYKATC